MSSYQRIAGSGMPAASAGDTSVNGVASATAFACTAAGAVGACAYRSNSGANTGIYFPSATSIAFAVGGVQYFAIDPGNGYAQSILGLSAPVLISRNGTSPVTVNTIFSSGVYCNNSGASITYNLPLIPGSGVGVRLTFIADSAASACVIKANTGQTIKMGASTSTAAGTLTSSTSSGAVTLVSVPGNATWYVDSMPTGTWAAA